MTVHTETLNGYTIRILYDEDCTLRDDDVHGLLELFDDCDWSIPNDGKIPRHWTNEDYSDWSLRQYAEHSARENKTRLIMQVMRDEHGPQSRYWVQAVGDDDSRCIGFLSYTEETLHMWGTPVNEGDERLVEMMEAEMRELTDWANGECYGYIIEDINGDYHESCWGFIGDMDYVLEEARSMCTFEQPARLYTVRLTGEEIAACVFGLGLRGIPDAGATTIEKFRLAMMKEE